MHSVDAITNLSISWLKEGWDRDRPFFLMHHYKSPHDYFEYAPRYESYLADTEIPEPENMWKRDPKFGSLATRGDNDELIPHIGTSIGRRNPRRSYAADFKIDPALSDEEAKRAAYNVYLKAYLRCVKGVDDNLQRLFDYLTSVGQLDNTLIIYTGDQGFMLGEHDYQDKRWMYEESQRMPFLVRYPKSIPPGIKTDAIIENVDFAPTMLAFAGIKTPEYMQGASFRKICETGNARLEAICVLSILDAHGTSRQSKSRWDSDQRSQIDFLLRSRIRSERRSDSARVGALRSQKRSGRKCESI
jgi:N-acetylglucosamine-6-sulfatase